MADDKTIVKAGEETSEFKVAKSGSFWAIVSIVIGMVVTIGSTIADLAGADTKLGMIVGAVIGIAGTIQKVLTDRGYIASRTQVKTSPKE